MTFETVITMTNAELLAKIKAEIEKLYDGEAPKHDQQCDFDDGYFTGIGAIAQFIDTLESEKPIIQDGLEEEKSAIDLIAEERKRQISKGFNWRHDDEHNCHQLSDAAIVYAAPGPLRYQVMNWWPWDRKWLKEDDSFTTEGRIRELIKAGALIVAEIERLQRTINNYDKKG